MDTKESSRIDANGATTIASLMPVYSVNSWKWRCAYRSAQLSKLSTSRTVWWCARRQQQLGWREGRGGEGADSGTHCRRNNDDDNGTLYPVKYTLDNGYLWLRSADLNERLHGYPTGMASQPPPSHHRRHRHQLQQQQHRWPHPFVRPLNTALYGPQTSVRMGKMHWKYLRHCSGTELTYMSYTVGLRLVKQLYSHTINVKQNYHRISICCHLSTFLNLSTEILYCDCVYLL